MFQKKKKIPPHSFPMNLYIFLKVFTQCLEENTEYDMNHSKITEIAVEQKC